MALPPNFLDELRARTPIRALIGRSVKLTRSGRETKGCCPFHGEKTPSYYDYDDHFHCFGCGEHGDVITFVMKTTGASFMEAVETLAGEAGLEVPKASPQAAQAEARRADIAEVLEAAGKLYQTWLFEPQGGAAL
jgi:DNA primase